MSGERVQIRLDDTGSNFDLVEKFCLCCGRLKQRENPKGFMRKQLQESKQHLTLRKIVPREGQHGIFTILLVSWVISYKQLNLIF